MNSRVGLLPFYIELYDKTRPQIRPQVDSFTAVIAGELEKRGIEVVASSTCRLKPEFETAVNMFESQKVDAIVTLHLAYSPSLESIDALLKTKLPIIVLDTTPTFGFGEVLTGGDSMFNHGIHGVQDMCSMLVRNKRAFFLEAGHWSQSGVLDRVAAWARAARTAACLRNMKVGLVGEPFKGMGDFQVAEDVLKSEIGLTVVRLKREDYLALYDSVSQEEIESEVEADSRAFEIKSIDDEGYRRCLKTCLALRKWMEREGLKAFTMNFLDISEKVTGLTVPPFLEASKAMARGLGYAGEGDVLTASLVAALKEISMETSFIEMFCPNWEKQRIYLSHMGEMDISLCDEKPMLSRRRFTFTDAEDPTVAYGRFKAGEVVLVDLAPMPEGKFRLIISKAKMLGRTGEEKADAICGWLKPSKPLEEFLKAYSLLGGTHHLAVVYGDYADDIDRFGRMMGWEAVRI